jgi:hypothetical protein
MSFSKSRLVIFATVKLRACAAACTSCQFQVMA